VGGNAFQGSGYAAVYLLAPGPSSVSVGSGAFVFSGGTPPLHVPASWAGTASFSTGTETYSFADGSSTIMATPALSGVSVSRTSARSASASFASSVSGSAAVLDSSGVVLWSGPVSAGVPVTASFSGIGPASAALIVRSSSVPVASSSWSGSFLDSEDALLPAFSYSVSFDGNGASAGSMGPQVMSWGSPDVLAASAYTRDGWSFAGWNTAPDGSGAAYADMQAASDLAESDMVLYAQWAPAPGPGAGEDPAGPASAAAAQPAAAPAQATPLTGDALPWALSLPALAALASAAALLCARRARRGAAHGPEHGISNDRGERR